MRGREFKASLPAFLGKWQKRLLAPAARASPVLGFLGDIGTQSWGYVAGHSVFLTLGVVLLILGSVAWTIARKGEGGKGRKRDAGDRNVFPAPSLPFSLDHGYMVPAFLPIFFPRRPLDPRRRLPLGRSRPWKPGDRLQSGQSLHLAAGVAEIAFDVGARVILQAPAARTAVGPTAPA